MGVRTLSNGDIVIDDSFGDTDSTAPIVVNPNTWSGPGPIPTEVGRSNTDDSVIVDNFFAPIVYDPTAWDDTEDHPPSG